MRGLATRFASMIAAAVIPIAVAGAQALPDAVAAPDMLTVMRARGVGAQIYACKADGTGKLAWQFREPVATLVVDGRTAGRHYAGPSWELTDGSFVAGKVAGNAPGTSSADIPWLKLDGSGGRGQFAKVTVIQRINTKGGVLAGACDTEAALTAVPYAADYLFLSKGN